jgi:hypothetical protein
VSVSYSELAEVFNRYKGIVSVWLSTERYCYDSDMGTKSFGYVKYLDAETAARALHALDCRLLDGREIRPDYAAPLRPRDCVVCVRDKYMPMHSGFFQWP